jgi:hypothetical protein
MANNPVRWFEIYVQDMARARKFYETVLGVKLEKLEGPDLEMWAFPMVMGQGGTSGSLVRAAGVPSGGNGTLVHFRCEDCAVEASRVLPAGGKLEREKMSIGPHGFIALAYDTEGNMIGLHSMQ